MSQDLWMLGIEEQLWRNSQSLNKPTKVCYILLSSMISFPSARFLHCGKCFQKVCRFGPSLLIQTAANPISMGWKKQYLTPKGVLICLQRERGLPLAHTTY